MSANRIDANRPTAERIIDGDTYTVQLDLSPIAAGLISDIARAMRGSGHLFTVLANTRPGSPEHHKVRQQILQRLQMGTALQVQLGPDQADDLSADLYDAKEEPSRCEGPCGGENYATRGDGLCERDGNAADLADASLTALRAV